MANLHFHYGAMGCSKSAQLIINAHNFRRDGVIIDVLKPQCDNRFAEDKIVSRAGNLETPATSLPNFDNYAPAPGTQVVLVDEIQFFAPSDIDKLVYIADRRGIIVLCYGLMVDSDERLFPASKRLVEVGAKLHWVESKCQIDGCLHRATHHLRFDSAGNIIRQGTQIAVGDENYKSVCRQHFNLMYHGIKQNTK